MNTTRTDYQLFVDLDGVLVNFEQGVLQLTGKEPAELHPSRMWPRLAKTPRFYTDLPWTPDGRDLWNAVVHLDPVILTGLPMGKWAEPQKREWCRRELGADIRVITGLSRHKPNLARSWLQEQSLSHKTPLLVDDRLKLMEPWEAVGGTFILHTDTARTLDELEKLNLLNQG